ncbi:hypothetical protein EV421DRAFT_1808008 [Armillaria borealis]|uniref:DRBM domain-containing protein n=1 Tax=Armillaria borealis TaxID=47425 RepID=A0AA39JGY9_9AGAR|nr:hypothetical protein EV421DRAFT_1808008 [Armillaria borealis]
MSSQTHYRQDLNNHAIQAGLALTYEEASSGPKNAVTWTITCLQYLILTASRTVGGVEHGKGSSTSKGQAKEIASYKAMVALGLINSN